MEARNPINPTGLEMGSGKGAGIAISTIIVLLWGSPPFRRPWKPEIQRNTRGLGNGLRKRSGYCKIDNLGAFCGVPPMSAAAARVTRVTSGSWARGARDTRDARDGAQGPKS